MKNLLKTIFGQTEKREALKLAREECEKRGWPWTEPVFIQRSFWNFYILTNSKYRGGNATFTVNARTGMVTWAAFARR